MAKVAAPLLALCLMLVGWSSALAEEPPKVVVVTREGGTVQMTTSRAPQSVQIAATGPLASAPPAVSSSTSMSRQQMGSLIKVAADSIPPEQMGCLVEAAGAGVETGALPRDLSSLTPAQMQWLAQRCQLSMAQLAPVAAEFLSSSATAAFASSLPTPTGPVVKAPTPTVEEKLQAMRGANAPKPSSGVSWPVVGLLGLSLGGSLAAGVGLGQIIGRASTPTARPKLRYATAPAAPAYRYTVSRPPVGRSSSGRLVGSPLPVQLGKGYLPKAARG